MYLLTYYVLPHNGMLMYKPILLAFASHLSHLQKKMKIIQKTPRQKQRTEKNHQLKSTY